MLPTLLLFLFLILYPFIFQLITFNPNIYNPKYTRLPYFAFLLDIILVLELLISSPTFLHSLHNSFPIVLNSSIFLHIRTVSSTILKLFSHCLFIFIPFPSHFKFQKTSSRTLINVHIIPKWQGPILLLSVVRHRIEAP